MNPTDTILVSALQLRELQQRHDFAEVTVVERDGSSWTYVAGGGLRLKTRRRVLKVPEETLEAAAEQRWMVADD